MEGAVYFLEGGHLGYEDCSAPGDLQYAQNDEGAGPGCVREGKRRGAGVGGGRGGLQMWERWVRVSALSSRGVGLGESQGTCGGGRVFGEGGGDGVSSRWCHQ